MPLIDRLVARFEGWILAIQAVDGVVGLTQEQEIGLERRPGKRKHTHCLTRLTTFDPLDVSLSSIRGTRGHNVYAKGEGVHERVRDKSKCGRCDGRAASTKNAPWR